ncbi:BMQ_0737 family morphogenetic spore coat protein [Paenibacillus apiarius]|uniref:DUF3794 domain-containing protein n=1 Tax=Paenibacillus apiarius TaxID=46240 RepID=A0ABT4DR30_9BACL|nr:hypothetical protein [Paenibacillus apiarius]MBN3523168.1 hypothetical protein [Paenibacillus apiarius]MCY9512548.1 hypothetical protein [Paenibacillus apiarius]MCY9519819.1 hypothetical protein [Paenibacillus apiarius]MCY9553136.1 hypothetical protein [Paenibacillus apiarius]MCY9559296.1 hypothetical protein [Paenibacillus apiarius]
MESKLVQGQTTPPEYLPLPSLECIEVPKIFDWVLKVTQIVDESTVDPMSCLPLPTSFRIEVRVVDVDCEEKVGSTRENVVVTVGGTPVTLQRVVIRKFGTYEVTIIDTSVIPNVVHCKYTKNFVRFEKVLLCAPPGTVIDCHIVPEATRIEFLDIVNNTFVNVDIVICQSIQVKANVKMMVEAELCQPRAEIPIPEGPCVVTFPQQCPDVFPGAPYPFPG